MIVPPDNLIAKYGGPAPRYTSYPTAPHFHAAVDASVVDAWLRTTRMQKASVYIHMAYCKSLCLYCGCNMKVTNSLEVVDAYVEALIQEMRRSAALLPHRLTITSLHFGGGTPSYASPSSLLKLMTAVRELFDIEEGAEISMEMDPRQLSDGVLAVFPSMGLNRASLGIQDTNPVVQEIIRRVQPHTMNLRAVQALRAAGVQGINVDLLYGLPGQTHDTLRQTISDILQLNPQRIALFGYAHVPWMKKHQVVLEPHGLPDARARLEMFAVAAGALRQAGYVPLGIDHFCHPDDPMARAAAQCDMHRNFMGYTTDASPLLLGFGASAISQYPQGYAQNITATGDYLAAVADGKLPVARGRAVTEEDCVRRGIIESLLCDMQAALPGGGLDAWIAQPHKMQSMMEDHLAVWDSARGVIAITEEGRPFARAVAACFDAYLVPESGRHSKAV